MKKALITNAIIFASLMLPNLAYAQTTTSSGSVDQIVSFLKSIVGVLTTVGGIVAVIFFVIGGISYMTSTGNPEALERSKKTIIFSAIGLSIVLGAYILSGIVTQLATTAFGSTGQ